jgi:hypothetical protein
MQHWEDGGRLEKGEKLTLGLLGLGRRLPHGRRQRRGRTERLWSQEKRIEGGGRGTAGKGGGHREKRKGRTTWAPSRHARCAAAAWQGERPAHSEEMALKRTSDFSRDIRHTSPGDPVRFCMPSGVPGVGVG